MEKILVVDDEPEIADLIEVYLRNENYDVQKCYTAEEAVKSIEDEELDLAILDVMLPNIDGFALCKKIREEHVYPIIMLTAKDTEVDKITGLALGADDYMTKPFKPLELMARVKPHLGDKRGFPLQMRHPRLTRSFGTKTWSWTRQATNAGCGETW